MIRNIIKIDEDLCNGCGVCATACHEGAIVMVDGKAKLIRDDYCDGLGACLPHCPTGALSFEEREAAAFDEEAVKLRMAELAEEQAHRHGEGHHGKGHGHGGHGSGHGHGGCPGSMARQFAAHAAAPATVAAAAPAQSTGSQLRQWPVQLQLVSPNAGFFDDAHLLIAADCAAYSHGDFHNRFLKGRVAVIGCPKLDPVDYSEKLTAILQSHNIKSVTVVRMEVPCCGGLEHAAVRALQSCGKMIPWQVVTLSVEGDILEL